MRQTTEDFMRAHADATDHELARELVKYAGALALKMREAGVGTDYKTSISDVVTDADRAAEEFVARALTQLRPDDGMLGEEGATRESNTGRVWVIDPVDGTYNFASGSDYFCSALALIDGDPSDPDDLLLGAVHRPVLDITWLGSLEGSTRNGVQLQRLVDKPLAEISVASYLHPTSMTQPAIRDAWLRGVQGAATIRMFGAGSIDLASVASGNVGAWLQHSVADWDWLPGKILVEGVGGAAEKVTAGGVEWCVAGSQQAVSEIASALSSD
ncbi:inositol monophosphatase family protein [Corynebacterium cystitidis]|uniref:Fructose-1,6-bisphosphatase n=1 Tax=Corynebacterium cystitidis DSM 20524 TaxID=1121357 RepID=A0A1H9WD96_9CORY|nr:inositol monophosphatase family protein [Corynebacterium cystitidis]WJY81834.1 Inositol-1-monophosphatase [Corynebacterium cystitidis DSM 20524]SES31759.1 fructose-1,6-bisphosphatase [Corynebacterium cystitidis DSM 20524]SNV83044.1 fructose-1,6-bisphosphatase [Corynebacterium cystitidis]